MDNATDTFPNGNSRQNMARTGGQCPGIVPKDVATTFSAGAPVPRFRGFSAARGEHRMMLAAQRHEDQHYEYIRTAGPEEGVCYFVGFDTPDGGLVKIGFTMSLARRLKQLRGTSGPYKLELLATCGGGRTAELHYHRKFSAHRTGGEWFERCPAIIAEIARLNEVVA